jgi:hypothetical protein
MGYPNVPENTQISSCLLIQVTAPCYSTFYPGLFRCIRAANLRSLAYAGW